MSAAAVPSLGGMTARRRRAIGLGIPLGAIAVGVLAGAILAGAKGPAVIGLVVLLAPPVLWRRPDLAPALVIFAALMIEQFPDPLGTSLQRLTTDVPLFHGLGAVHLSPADLMLGGIVVLLLVKREHRDFSGVLRAPLGVAIAGLLVAVVIGLATGTLHHGDIRVSFMEIRPYVYLATAYVLAASLVTSRRALQAVLWAIVIAGAFKGVQALFVFASVRHMVPRPDAVLGHEEALFFGVSIMLTGALWVFDVRGRLRTVATWALPVVLAGDLANSRRTAWLILAGGLVVLAAVGAKCVPARRLMITRVTVVTCLLLAVYMPAYWNRSGGLAQPARAIRSIVAPNARDASSDLYRVQEDENLKLNIQMGGFTGRGFGVPIDYVLPIVDISEIDPYIAYVPHNGILYIFMRMGLLGAVAVWSVLATAVVAACKLARCRERRIAIVGALVACSIIGYTLEAAVDQGFFMYRVAFVVGTLLGLVVAGARLAQRAEARRAADRVAA